MVKITPTIGRVVWYHPDPNVNPDLINAAIVTHVHGLGHYVNLACFDEYGNNYSQSSVRLVQEGEDIPLGERYAEWMPYQKGQAKKTEALEAEVAKDE